jgi:hypothetical protein
LPTFILFSRLSTYCVSARGTEQLASGTSFFVFSCCLLLFAVLFYFIHVVLSFCSYSIIPYTPPKTQFSKTQIDRFQGNQKEAPAILQIPDTEPVDS